MSVLRIPTAEAYDPLLAPARYKAAYGGRGSGKSRFFAGLMIEENIAERMDNVCLREVQKSLQFSVKKELELTIEEYNAGAHFEVQDKRILTKRGGIIIFEGLQHHTATSIKSLARFRRAWTEEAQDLSANSLKILRPTMRDQSEMWFSWNPRNKSDPVDAFFRGDAAPPDSIIVQANYMENPWFPDDLRMEMEWDREHRPDDFAHVWLGDYEERSEARVFKNWRVEEFDERPAGTIHRLGADWGFSIDPSVMLRCSIDGKLLYVDHEAYRIGCEIDQLPDLFMQIPAAEKWPSVADSSRPETISYMRKHGFPKMGAAIKGANSVAEGIQFLQSFEIVVHPRCEHLIRELSLYKYKKDPKTDEILPILEDKNNHCIDALRYACESARRAGKAPKPAVLKPRTHSSNGWMST